MTDHALAIPEFRIPTGDEVVEYPLGLVGTATGLDFSNAALTMAETGHLVAHLYKVRAAEEAKLRTLKFYIGDAIRYGERWGEDFAQFLEAHYAAQTRYNMAWVCGRVAPMTRRPELSFEHHAEVAVLPGKDQREVLDKAVTEEWGRDQTRKAVRELQAKNDGRDPSLEEAVRALAAARAKLLDLEHTKWADLIAAHLVLPLAGRLMDDRRPLFLEAVTEDREDE